MEHLDVLLEIGCEELPVEYIAPALRQMQTLAADKLTEARLEYASLETEATPRRLVLFVRGLATAQPQQVKTIQGPTTAVAYKPDGTLTPAGEGFVRKTGLKPEQIEVKDGRLTARVTEESRSARELLPGILGEIISCLTFPKSMRWEASGVRFARPVRWLLALLGSEALPVKFADIVAGRHTRLHPLHAPLLAEVPDVASYTGILEKGWVLLSIEGRRARLRARLEQEATRLGGRAVADEPLLDMLVMMTEHPGIVSGSFDGRYLEIPREIVITAMREHQRYFAVETADGALLPAFLAGYDNPLAEPESIRPGCERVLEARLKDAEFFFCEDMKRPLASLVPELSRVLWIKGLGHLLDKTQRLERLAAWLANKLDPGQEAAAREAAHLAKADLITNMVQEKEFTSLQGIMGTYYALAQGVSRPAALAIREQYQPRGAGDALPVTPAGRILALADKLDHLAGCWGAGFVPTGAKDPYALRRAAQGVVAITLDAGYRFSLSEVLAETVRGFAQYQDRSGAIAAEVKAFILGRMETELANRRYPPDLIQALLAVWTDDLAALVRKAEVITALQGEPDFRESITAFSRVVNILPKGTPRDTAPETPELAVTPRLLAAASEQALAEAVGRTRNEVLELARTGDFMAVFRRLAAQVPLINRFFEEVLVMDPDEAKRTNRLSLLTNLARLIWLLADFSRIVDK